MKNNKLLPLIMFLSGAVLFVAGALIFCLDGRALKITGVVLMVLGGLAAFAGGIFGKIISGRKDGKPQHMPYSEPLVLQSGNVTAINNGDCLNLDIWGEVRKISIASQRLKAKGEPLNQEEIDALNAVICSGVLNSEQVKAEVLRYENEVTSYWDDDYYEGKITSILPPETEITDIIIDICADGMIVAYCGEALCDEEHGISITFINGKFAKVSAFMDFN